MNLILKYEEEEKSHSDCDNSEFEALLRETKSAYDMQEEYRLLEGLVAQHETCEETLRKSTSNLQEPLSINDDVIIKFLS